MLISWIFLDFEILYIFEIHLPLKRHAFYGRNDQTELEVNVLYMIIREWSKHSHTFVSSTSSVFYKFTFKLSQWNSLVAFVTLAQHEFSKQMKRKQNPLMMKRFRLELSFFNKNSEVHKKKKKNKILIFSTGCVSSHSTTEAVLD